MALFHVRTIINYGIINYNNNFILLIPLCLNYLDISSQDGSYITLSALSIILLCYRNATVLSSLFPSAAFLFSVRPPFNINYTFVSTFDLILLVLMGSVVSIFLYSGLLDNVRSTPRILPPLFYSVFEFSFNT